MALTAPQLARQSARNRRTAIEVDLQPQDGETWRMPIDYRDIAVSTAILVVVVRLWSIGGLRRYPPFLLCLFSPGIYLIGAVASRQIRPAPFHGMAWARPTVNTNSQAPIIARPAAIEKTVVDALFEVLGSGECLRFRHADDSRIFVEERSWIGAVCPQRWSRRAC